MSAFGVNEICWRLVHDPPFRETAKADPAAAIRDAAISEPERTALLAGDVAELYRRGAHAFLLGHLARYGFAGLTVPIYNARMRAIAGEPSAG